MNAELTLYRCYWPQAYGYLKGQQAAYRAEAQSMLLTVKLPLTHALTICELLPHGAVVHCQELAPVETDASGATNEALIAQAFALVREVIERDLQTEGLYGEQRQKKLN